VEMVDFTRTGMLSLRYLRDLDLSKVTVINPRTAASDMSAGKRMKLSVFLEKEYIQSKLPARPRYPLRRVPNGKAR
jgi:hypothetical protein